MGSLSGVLRLPKPMFASMGAGAGQTVSGQTYWMENGAVYQMPSGTSNATVIVGFQNLAAFVTFCFREATWCPAPPTFYGNTIFTGLDFPVALDILPNPNKKPTADQSMVFGSKNASSFALDFLMKAGFTWLPPRTYTLISWEQAAGLAVASTNGPQTVSLAYLAMSQKAVATTGIEVMWDAPPLG